MATARRFWLTCSGSRNSSIRISPGWMGVMVVMGGTSSVVVHDLDVGGSGVGPDEADPPLLVDADAVLSGPVPAECFQPVARRHSQVVERFGSVQHHQLPQGCSFDTWVDALDSLP